MKMYNGFKVVKSDEKIVGKVVEISKEGFKLVEYYVNEYNTYDKRELETFNIQIQENTEETWKEFNKKLGNYVRLSSAQLEESVVSMLNLL